MSKWDEQPPSNRRSGRYQANVNELDYLIDPKARNEVGRVWGASAWSPSPVLLKLEGAHTEHKLEGAVAFVSMTTATRTTRSRGEGDQEVSRACLQQMLGPLQHIYICTLKADSRPGAAAYEPYGRPPAPRGPSYPTVNHAEPGRHHAQDFHPARGHFQTDDSEHRRRRPPAGARFDEGRRPRCKPVQLVDTEHAVDLSSAQSGGAHAGKLLQMPSVLQK